MAVGGGGRVRLFRFNKMRLRLSQRGELRNLNILSSQHAEAIVERLTSSVRSRRATCGARRPPLAGEEALTVFGISLLRLTCRKKLSQTLTIVFIAPRTWTVNELDRN